jgi:zinc transporter, ZIP family
VRAPRFGDEPLMAAAFGWGTLAASSLVIGALLALLFRISLPAIGLIMGFGAGVLISAVAFDLVEEAAGKSSGHGAAIAGIFAGCGVFFGGDWLIDRAGGADRKDAKGAQESGSALAIVLGTVLDGIPESMVIGLTIFEGGAVGAAYLVAVFISNLPEAISSTAGLSAGGWKKARILWLWIAITLISGGRLARRLRPLPALLTRHRRLRSCLRSRCDPHHARGHDDARGVRTRRQAGRRRDDARIRDRVRDPYTRLSHARPSQGTPASR